MPHQDKDRVIALTAANTAYQGMTASDLQTRVAMGAIVASNNDEINRVSGAKAYDIGGVGTPCRK